MVVFEFYIHAADKIWSHTPDAYVILEHFADNAEEKELAEYRVAEGKGMMLWGNYNGAYSQNTTGAAGADFSTVYHSNRNWTVPHLIGYMESHDEERLMYRNLQTGRSAGSYNVKTLTTALDRMKAASLMLFTIPGPKMLWQFGELGYDQSINRCPDGTINEGCRVSPKPVKWDYLDNADRHALYSHIAELLELRNTYKVFTDGVAAIQSGTSFVKQFSLQNVPYTLSPADASQMNVHIVANFDVIAKGAAIEFLHPGAWFDYYSGQAVSVSGRTHNLTLKPGEYKLFTDYALKEPVTSVLSEMHHDGITLYPNPVENELFTDEATVKWLTLYTTEGKQVAIVKRSDTSWDLSGLPKGLYIVKVEDRRGVRHAKIIKR